MNIQKEDLEEIARIARDLHSSLSRTMNSLSLHEKRVERDLNLEAENLKDLVSGQDREIQSQLVALDESIAEHHASLVRLRHDLAVAVTTASQLDGLLPDFEKQEEDSKDEGYQVDMSPREAAEIRHDEPTTVGSVIRSLLMANEPQQRERRETKSL